jgi:hypothetical protein
VGRAKPVRAEADARSGRAGHMRDEQGAVVTRLGEVWLYYELCSLIFPHFAHFAFWLTRDETENHKMEPISINLRYNFIILVRLDMIAD